MSETSKLVEDVEDAGPLLPAAVALMVMIAVIPPAVAIMIPPPGILGRPIA